MGNTASLLRAELERFAEAHQLTPREQDVVYLLLQGKGAVQRIAEELGLSQNTVHNHFKSIFRRTKTNSKAALLAMFIEQALQGLAQVLPFVRRPTVMVADPDERERAQVQAALSAHGLRSLAQTDMTLLDVDAAPGVDAVVLRVRGSVDAGSQAERILRENASRCPFFILADNAETETRTRWQGLGAVAVLAHDGPSDELVFAILHEVIRSPYDRSRLFRVDTQLQASVDHRYSAGVDNLGFGGAFLTLEDGRLETAGAMRVGRRLHVQLPLNGGSSIGVEGEVRWTRVRSRPAKPAGFGVQFVGLQEQEREALERFVRRHKLEAIGAWPRHDAAVQRAY